MKITDSFDSGNIRVLDCSDPNNIQLEIKKDHQSDFFQWFHFQVQATPGTKLKLRIMNAHESAYVPGWKDYKAVASYDKLDWFRVETTSFDGKELVIEFTPQFSSTRFCYFAPYSNERHLDLLESSQLDVKCTSFSLGETLDGREMTLLKVGSGEKKVWMTARQHPGESMAEWFVEGFLETLLNEAEPISRKVLEKASFYIVPNMNPDGSFRGHLRTNAAGINLNREWQTPSLEKSPEVFHVRNMMDDVGVDLFLDIHGDENLPYNFVAGCEGNASFTDEIERLGNLFREAFVLSSPDFQTEFGYPVNKKGEGNMTVATNAVSDRFNCLAFTLEMPFKDNAKLPCPKYGWSPQRSKILGRDILRPILTVLEQI
ncbi:M14-type cytosolic carboxypeptidase [Halobacteriovorax sp. HLS]|uniref:M14 family metallopeptidase n=1 Tax=Halobacteriovorax sp. HLS TaxID=2234000 RepID=UPI000FDAC534